MSNLKESLAWRNAPKVIAWEKALKQSGCHLERLEPLQILNKRDGSLLFALVHAYGVGPDQNPLLPYALLQGPACVVVPHCRHRITGETRFLMIHQRRMGHGGLSLEFPAGMLDENISDPKGVAVKEMEEETGLKVKPSELNSLWNQPLFSSPGISNESIHFFSAEFELDALEWETLEGSEKGHAHEGEFITTTMKTFSEAVIEITSLQTLMAFMLYFKQFGAPK